jgi:sugar-specific transcriptional regulator TrmB
MSPCLVKEAELAAELMKFGVTKQEADLFLLLTRVRNAGPKGVTGNELSELGGIGRVRTYQLLDGLVDLGIVQVEVGRPKRYLAEDPQTAVRRLVALQESRLDELSHAEEAVAEGLANATPLAPRELRPEKEGGSKVAVLHGISMIHSLLRRAMQGRKLRVVVNDESEDHVFTTVRYMTRKPKSVEVIFATTEEKREPFQGGKIEIDGYTYKIRLFKGDLPTIVLNGEQCIMLFYESQRYRPKPLSPVTVRTVVSSCVVIEGAKQVGQMETTYEKLWNLAA